MHTIEHSEGVGENNEQLMTRMLISLADTPVDASTYLCVDRCDNPRRYDNRSEVSRRC